MFKNVHYFWLCFFFTISNVYKYCLDLLLFSVFLDSFSLWCLQSGIKIGIFIFLALYSCIYSLSGFSAKDQCVNVQHIWRDLNMWLPEMLMCDLKQAFHSWKPCSVVDLKKKKKKTSAKASRPKFLHSDLKDIASNHTLDFSSCCQKWQNKLLGLHYHSVTQSQIGLGRFYPLIY